ncbi:dTDP-Rha--alpha-D-GlcNAc-pyrophosphate polyprenol alpha-3-L-rhamnosyltransferase [Polaribacter reichenbachii]|uniref:Glycosyl transferase family 2 n=1 Tax=Polaribacter reichenbachii TaxID=996801 RepID=A0A1B8U4J0_9FLAO|nr:glycosyltransferase family 2 protein [Polaribacter reichenbachii]APZ47526.1 dTDP-Rha--alpha-D-GlcNAc-pyrophosphate polyprenol alpha-3-L-rhamnosyltransferase [Polaribacter reichenbachii]AUC18165.1 dTDP-Rha--alpha-D-GlcNAc-pyrophosphate polyprenol alpha-3-L-rhamnosyltransferase [Polaribacter reichenbachii]OBY66776.1 glycosyl transferase family 2 [Polaribacter reichenbachii]
MKTAIVILNWNGQKLLEQFLPSIVNFSINEAEIYVADNASTDISISFIKANFPSVKIIKNAVNGGYAKGYNDALQNIEADIYCLINSDVEVTKNWLSPILDVFKSDEKTAIIQPKILDYKNKSKFEYAGAGGGFIDLYGYPYCRGRVFNHLETDENQFNDISEIFWASGACLFIRSTIYHKIGGFDEDYFAHQEEIDLCWRTQNIGYKVKYVGTSTIYHVGGATLQETNPHKTYLNFRNSLLNVVKNVPKKWFLFVVFSRLILDGIAGIKFIFELRPIHTWAILKAHFSFYANFNKFLKKRKSLQKKQDYNLHTSIVWQYFVLGRKEFKNLR